MSINDIVMAVITKMTAFCILLGYCGVILCVDVSTLQYEERLRVTAIKQHNQCSREVITQTNIRFAAAFQTSQYCQPAFVKHACRTTILQAGARSSQSLVWQYAEVVDVAVSTKLVPSQCSIMCQVFDPINTVNKAGVALLDCRRCPTASRAFSVEVVAMQLENFQ